MKDRRHIYALHLYGKQPRQRLDNAPSWASSGGGRQYWCWHCSGPAHPLPHLYGGQAYENYAHDPDCLVLLAIAVQKAVGE